MSDIMDADALIRRLADYIGDSFEVDRADLLDGEFRLITPFLRPDGEWIALGVSVEEDSGSIRLDDESATMAYLFVNGVPDHDERVLEQLRFIARRCGVEFDGDSRLQIYLSETSCGEEAFGLISACSAAAALVDGFRAFAPRAV